MVVELPICSVNTESRFGAITDSSFRIESRTACVCPVIGLVLRPTATRVAMPLAVRFLAHAGGALIPREQDGAAGKSTAHASTHLRPQGGGLSRYPSASKRFARRWSHSRRRRLARDDNPCVVAGNLATIGFQRARKTASAFTCTRSRTNGSHAFECSRSEAEALKAAGLHTRAFLRGVLR